MKQLQKIKYLRIAMGIQGIGMREITLAKIIATYEAVLKKGDTLTIKDIVEIEHEVDIKYAPEE